MPNLSWNEMHDKAVEFSVKYKDIVNERAESQSFWTEFLSIFGVDRRRAGAYFEHPIKKGDGSQGFIDMFYPAKLLVEQKSGGRDLDKANVQAFDYLATIPDHELPEAVVVSDFANFQFLNLETGEKATFVLADLSKHIKLFGFLVGQTSKKIAEQDPVNRQAAEAMAKLHNQLRDDNYVGHDLELLLVRLVFLMFADDSGIFERSLLLEYIENRTAEDGSDLGVRISHIFQILNTPEDKRQSSLDEAIASLPYVNGGLFAESINSPSFSGSMRRELIKAMKLDWSKVSPAIFGSMFQGVMDEKQRRDLGAHYTSEINILRVIKPLFLDDLYDEFRRAVKSGPRKKFVELRAFQDKLANLKFLDPACGCGNFLVITYRELRRLEHKVALMLAGDPTTQEMFVGSDQSPLKVNVDQMYGIEIEEFPSLIAQTALWLTDHQMNMEYSQQAASVFKRIPLTTSATIVNDNALTKDWAEVVAPSELDYILGNPPFLGQTYQSKKQKQQVAEVLNGIKKTGVLDFVTAWYGKATKYMQNNRKIQTALVSTNSITQGEQVSVLWKYLLDEGVKINFAHRTFKWTNDARGVAGVHCVIIGFALFESGEKRIFDYADIKDEPIELKVKDINPYLVDAPNIAVESRTKSLSEVPQMVYGNKPTDGGNLFISPEEYKEFVDNEPLSERYIKKVLGSSEFINNRQRFCLWLVDCSPEELRRMPLVVDRVEKVRDFRLASTKKATRESANQPTLFQEVRQPKSRFIIVPRVSSELRSYVPIGFVDAEVIVNDSVQIIPHSGLFHFGVLTSQMHMAWMRVVAGRLESRYRYSKDIVYNNFIWPEDNEAQTSTIEKLAQAVLDARAEFPNASLADLYDPLTMPPVLARAHKVLDRAVDKLYTPKPFATDADRVALLFQLYQQKTSE